MNLHAVRMKFISYRKTSKVNMLYPCDTNEVDMRVINSSHKIHMKFIWISNDLNFTWTSCEFHKNYRRSTKEVPLHYTWLWLLASLPCTSYEWASRSIVQWQQVPIGSGNGLAPSRRQAITCSGELGKPLPDLVMNQFSYAYKRHPTPMS